MLAVATWNLENFFQPQTAEGALTSKDKYEEKLKGLADVIDELSPDVLAVQEVGQPGALKDLAKKLDGDWSAVTSKHPDHRGIRVGFLSTLPISQKEEIVSFPSPLAPIQQGDSEPPEHDMGRGALHVQVTKDGTKVDLVTCHLKSKLLSFPGTNGKTQFDTSDEDLRARYGAYALFRRAAEATTVRSYVDRLLDGNGSEPCVVVLGDLNDQPSAATTQILLGPPGSEFGTPGFSHPDKGDKMRLWSVAPLIPDEEAYSRTFEGHRELIDHILVSHRLADPEMEVTIHHQAKASIGTDPKRRRDAPASDHDPVMARLSI